MGFFADLQPNKHYLGSQVPHQEPVKRTDQTCQHLPDYKGNTSFNQHCSPKIHFSHIRTSVQPCKVLSILIAREL